MGKRTRIVLYALSLVTMLAMVTLIIFSHGRQSGEPAKDVLSETDISSTEEPVQIPEAEESEETEAADGQNRIQNDTEQEEADIAGGETDKQAEAGNTEGDGSTTLIFAGDVLFANAFKSNYDAGGIEKVIEPQLLQELQDADIFMVNNEFPFSNRGEPMEDKQFTFCCDPKYVKALNEMGVDIVSLANNHTLDYGSAADRHVFADLEVRDSLAGAGDHRLLAGDLGHVANGEFDVLLVVNGFTNAHVERDLGDARNLHDSLVAELLHEFGDNGVVIKGAKTRHGHPHSALAPTTAPLDLNTRTFLPSTSLKPMRSPLPVSGLTSITLD